MADLFEIPDPRAVADDPRTRTQHMERPKPTGPRVVSSPDEMIEIFTKALRDEAPERAKCEMLWASEYRRAKEVGAFSINAVQGKVTPHQFYVMCRNLLQKDNEGTMVHTLNRTQGNGVWVPVVGAMRRGERPCYQGVKDAKHRLPNDTSLFDEIRHLEPTVYSEDVLDYVIWWVDAANQKDIRYDTMGHPVADMDVKVQTGMDPMVAASLAESAAATRALAEAVAQGKSDARVSAGVERTPTDAELMADAEREVEAALAAEELRAKKVAALEKARAVRAANRAKQTE